MKKIRTDYTFDASAKTITFTDAITIEQIFLITNLVNNVVIYQFNSATKGGTLSGLVLTLAHDTAAMADTDELQIIVDDADARLTSIESKLDSLLTELQLKANLAETQPISAASLPLPAGAATSANQTALNDSLTNGTNKIKLWDGTEEAQIDAYNAGTLGTDKALKTSTVIHGLSSGGGGTYVDVKVNPSGALVAEVTAGANLPVTIENTTPIEVTPEFHNHHMSAFGDFVSVDLTQIVDMDFVNGLDDSCMVATSGAGSSVSVANNQAVITVGTGSSDYAILFSDRPTRYRARLGIRVAFTPVFASPIANCTQLKGAANFAESAPQTLIDGYFFGYYVGTDSTSTAYDGTTFGILHINSASGSRVDRFYPKTQWLDPMDGTGDSGINWDKTKGMTVEIDYPYQGYGSVFFKATKPATGEYYDILVIPYPNTASVPQLSNPNLRYWDGVINSGNTTSKATKVGSVGTFICGTKRYTAKQFPMLNNKTVTSGVQLCLLAVQIPKTFNASAVRGLARLATLTAYSGGNAFGFIRVILNPTITGAVWAVNDSTLTVPTGGTVSLTGSDGNYTVNSSAGTYAINPFVVDTTGTSISGGRLIDAISLGLDTNFHIDYDVNPNREMPAFKGGDIIAFVADPKASGSMGVTVKFLNEL